jgi:exosortase/archaeosortase family protein
VVMSVGGLLLGGPALRNDLALPLESLYRHRHGLPLLAIHLGLFAAFVWFSCQLPFDIPTVSELIIDNQRWLPTAWVLLGLGVVSYWVLFFLPAGLWSALVNHGLQMFVPSCLLAIGCVAAARFTWPLWTPLASVTMRGVFAVLTFFYSDAVFDRARQSVGTSHFEVTIGPLCSGFEGIGLGCFFLLNYFALFRSDLRFPAVLVLLPIAAVLMWLTNIGRIAGLIAIGDAGRPDIALGGFHSQAGWLLFLIVSFGLVGVSRHFSCFMTIPRWRTWCRSSSCSAPSSRPECSRPNSTGFIRSVS